MQKLKNIIGNNAHWTINKKLAKDIGLNATIVLQHFIDLQYSFYKDGGFYQQQNRLLDDLPLSIDYLRKSIKVLVKKGFLSVTKKGIPAKNHYTVYEEDVLSYLLDTSSDASGIPLDVSLEDDLQSTGDTTNTNNQDSKNQESNNSHTNDEKRRSSAALRKKKEKNKPDIEILLDKLIDRYPGSINARGPMLKALKQLSTEERKLALKNVDRYTKAWDWATNYHNLRNYLESKKFSESELTKIETKQKKNNSNNNKELVGTKKFKADYEDV